MKPEQIREINYIYYSSFRSQVEKTHSLPVCYILFFLLLIKSLIKSVRFRTTSFDINEVLFFVPTLNNKKSVGTIIDHLPEDKITVWGDLRKDLPWFKIYSSACLNHRSFYSLYKSSSSDDKKLMRYFFRDFITTTGYCSFFESMIKKSPRLKVIVFANDHSTECRCLIEQARKLGVRTLYVQHASVTERFPPLHFSYSFLDGMESYEKYKTNGDISGLVFLTGSPRFDEINTYKKNDKLYDLGIAINMLDNCSKVLDLCKYLINTGNYSMIVRPHPRMGTAFDEAKFIAKGISISNPSKESSFCFLSKVKYLIANESSIHLDAALLGVSSTLFNFSNAEITDWYSYVKNGLITVSNNYHDIENNIRCHNECIIEKIRYYNAAYKTPFDGKIGAFIAQFIVEDILSVGSEKFIEKNMKDENGCFVYDVD